MIVPLTKSQTRHPALPSLSHTGFLTKKVLQSPSLAPIYYRAIALKRFVLIYDNVVSVLRINLRQCCFRAEIDRLRTIKKNNEPGEGFVDWFCRVKRSWGARARAG